MHRPANRWIITSTCHLSEWEPTPRMIIMCQVLSLNKHSTNINYRSDVPIPSFNQSLKHRVHIARDLWNVQRIIQLCKQYVKHSICKVQSDWSMCFKTNVITPCKLAHVFGAYGNVCIPIFWEQYDPKIFI